MQPEAPAFARRKRPTDQARHTTCVGLTRPPPPSLPSPPPPPMGGTADQRPRHQGAHREDRTASLELLVTAIKEGTPMHHTRLACGLISLAAFLTIPARPQRFLADTSVVTAPSHGATPEPTPAGRRPRPRRPHAGAERYGYALRMPRPTWAQRRAKRLALRLRTSGAWSCASRAGCWACPTCTAARPAAVSTVPGSRCTCTSDSAGACRTAPPTRPRAAHRVSLRRLEIGDLVFYGGSGYYSHVGIYAGHGRVIDAPHGGAVVSYSPVGGAATVRRLIGS